MLGTYDYHEIIRKTIIAFGTLFNNIEIRHKKQDGSSYSVIKVPIAYGPAEKFLARIEQKQDLRKRVSIVLPRLAFEITNIQYDAKRKVSTMQTFKTVSTDGSKIAKKVYMPVPYNVGFRLSLLAQYNEDALQVVEQILPFFQPSFNLTVDLVSSIGEKRDIPIILDSINFEDNYDQGYEEKRVIVYNLDFTAKTFLFGPIANSTEGLIKKVQVDYHTTIDKNTARRELRYTAEARATKDYNNDGTSVILEDIDEKITSFRVANVGSLSVESYIYINQEEMLIKKIDGDNITVVRGMDTSIASSHKSGDAIDIINSIDDDLIDIGDDFGFSESRFDFGDGRVYSPTKGVDVWVKHLIK